MPASRVPYPKGIVTFLFTDIVGSTNAARALPYQHYSLQLLQPQFDEIKRLVEQEHKGRISGTPAGDSIMAAFADVNNALNCAIQIQNVLPTIKHTDRDGKEWALSARIGVHTSEMQVTPNAKGEYLNHPDVIYAARIMSVAHGGQIVLSANGHKQCDDKRWTWQEWKNRRIKSFEEAPQILHELLYEGWTSKEPGSQFLPAWFQEMNRYVPRPNLEAAILNLFQTKMPSGFLYRLVTLHGFGGMGKTRLAMQCCVQAVGIFAGRLYCVELDTLGVSNTMNDAAKRDFLAGRIAEAFQLKDEAAAPDNLPHSLPKDVSLLLLLDNYETVKCGPAKRLVEKLLTTNPLLHILVTGRKSVELNRVELPKDVRGLEAEEGRDLLIARIRESKADFTWTPSEADNEAIATILRVTANIPLAIELAAARIRNRTLPEIAASISKAVLGEMTDSREERDANDPEWRHDTLEKCYDWSWNLLNEPEQTAFALCSLFANDCVPQEITACFPAIMPEHLDALQEASLLVYTAHDGHSLYFLLHPTREYARKRLHKIDADQEQQRYFVAYYRQIVQENGGSANTEDREKRERLETAWRHAVSAADIAPELQDTESSGNIADLLVHFVDRQALWAEGTFLYTRSLEIRRKALPVGHPEIAASLNNLAGLYESQGRYADAEPLYLQALDIKRQNLGKDHPSLATSLNNLAGLYESQGRYADAEPLYLQALDIRRKALPDGHPEIAASLNNLAELYKSQGRYADAEPLYLQALDIDRVALGENHPGYATDLNNLAGLYKSQGRYADAEPLYLQALDVLVVSLGPRHPNTATVLSNLLMMLVNQERRGEIGAFLAAKPELQETYALLLARQSA